VKLLCSKKLALASGQCEMDCSCSQRGRIIAGGKHRPKADRHFPAVHEWHQPWALAFQISHAPACLQPRGCGQGPMVGAPAQWQGQLQCAAA